MRVAALESVQGFSQHGRQVVLTVTCREKHFWIEVHFGDRMQPMMQVAYHFVPQPGAQTATWSATRDGEGLRVSEPVRFARELLRSSQLTVRVSFSRGEQNVAVFRLRGVSQALRPVLAACRP